MKWGNCQVILGLLLVSFFFFFFFFWGESIWTDDFDSLEFASLLYHWNSCHKHLPRGFQLMQAYLRWKFHHTQGHLLNYRYIYIYMYINSLFLKDYFQHIDNSICSIGWNSSSNGMNPILSSEWIRKTNNIYIFLSCLIMNEWSQQYNLQITFIYIFLTNLLRLSFRRKEGTFNLKVEIEKS